MLGGLAPIIIFEFFKVTPTQQASISAIPLFSNYVNKLSLPPIPIYLDEKLTGLYIDSQDKGIEIETQMNSLIVGTSPLTQQNALQATTKVTMKADKGSLGLMLLSAVADLIVPKVVSQEYAITYLNGATTIFGGLLHSFNVVETSGSSLVQVVLEISKGSNKKSVVTVPPPTTETAVLTDGVTPPTKLIVPPLQGPPPQLPKQAPITMGGLR